MKNFRMTPMLLAFMLMCGCSLQREEEDAPVQTSAEISPGTTASETASAFIEEVSAMPETAGATETAYDEDGGLWYYDDNGAWTYDEDGMWYIDNDGNVWLTDNEGNVEYLGGDDLGDLGDYGDYSDELEGSAEWDVGTQAASKGRNDSGFSPGSGYQLREAKWTQVNWTTFECPYFTLKVPEGWEVTWDGNSENLMWTAQSRDEYVGIQNIAHGYAAKDPNAMTAQTTAFTMTDGTVEEFFKKNYEPTTDYFNIVSSVVPGDLSQLQEARPTAYINDYRSLFAYFRQDGVDAEGVFSAIVVYTDPIVIRGYDNNPWEIDCILAKWAPEDELVNWADVLSTVAGSFTYTQYFGDEWLNIARQSTDGRDPVMEAFEERDRSDTIIQEKRSDMIGEYERVYDNETGKIYRAYDGFLDDIGDQSRYTSITDDQYADGYSGWIDKLS